MRKSKTDWIAFPSDSYKYTNGVNAIYRKMARYVKKEIAKWDGWAGRRGERETAHPAKQWISIVYIEAQDMHRETGWTDGHENTLL